MDGFDLNGTVIYVTRQRALPDGLTLLGFPESNRDFRRAELRHHVLLGETGDDFYALDQTTGASLPLDHASLSPLEAYPRGNANRGVAPRLRKLAGKHPRAPSAAPLHNRLRDLHLAQIGLANQRILPQLLSCPG